MSIQPLSSWRLIWKRSISDWKLLISIALGVLVATSVVVGTPIYLKALESLAIKNAVDRNSEIFLDITVHTPYVVLEHSYLDRTDKALDDAIETNLPSLVKQQERYLKGPTFLSALPGRDIEDPTEDIPPSQGYLQYLSNLGKHVTIIEGRMPTDTVLQTNRGPMVEAALASSTSEFFRLRPGDVLTLSPSADTPERVFARITALIMATDPGERYWQGNAAAILTPPPIQPMGEAEGGDDEEEPPIALMVTKDALVGSLSQAHPGTVVSSTWFVIVNRDVVKTSPTSQTIEKLEAFEAELMDHMARVGVFTGILPLIREYNERLFFSRVPFYLLMTLMLAAVLYFLVMMTAYIVQRREEEVALLRSRGVVILQLLRLYTLEGLLLTGIAVVVAPFLAAGTIALLGKLPYFHDLTGGDTLSVSLGFTPFLASLGAGFICLLILVIPRAVGSRSGLVGHKLRSSRPPSVPIFHRYYLDIGLLIIGGFIFWELKARGTLISGGLFNTPSVNEALLFAPILFLIAVTLIFMRIFPIFIRLISKLLAERTPVWTTLSLWHMARNPLRYSWLVLLLVLATGLGILAATLGGTLKLSYEERVSYDTATDLRVERLPGYIRMSRSQLKEAYLTIPGASSASLAFRGSGRIGATRTGAPFNILAMETQYFPYMSWYRDDFSRSSLPSIMRTLRAVEQFPPLELHKDAKKVGLWVKPGNNYPNVFLWLVFQDAKGLNHTVTLGPMGEPEWHFLETEVPPYSTSPLTLKAIEIYEPVYGPTGTPGYLYIDNIQTTVSSTDGYQTVEGFEDKSNWIPLATSVLSSDSLSLTRIEVQDGRSAAFFQWGKGTNRGIRGVYRSPSGEELPIVASTSFLASTGRNVGDSMILTVLERFIPVVIRDVVEYFPTLNPRQSAFVLADMDLLLDHMNLISPLSTVSPNEIFLSTTSDSHETAVQVAQSFVQSENQIHDREGQLMAIRLDPLITAGWRILIFLSIGVILFTTSLGYLTYLLSSSIEARGEMGFLQAFGLSRRQIMGMLALEHLVMVVVGVALGTWAGLQMSTLSISTVSQTETGQPILPPFILVTEWGFMALIYAFLAGIVLVSLFILNRSIVRLDLNTISKLER